MSWTTHEADTEYNLDSTGTGDVRLVITSERAELYFWMKPQTAREVAELLLQAATDEEGITYGASE